MNALQLLDMLQAQGIMPPRLTLDSRRVSAGDIFIAQPGTHSDGRHHIDEALTRGAAAVLYDPDGFTPAVSPLSTFSVPQLGELVGELAHQVYGRPSEQLWLAGITGTNGKTSVAHWIAQALNALDCKCGVIGTLGNGFPPDLDASPNTTPDAITLHASLARFLHENAAACAMEVSSIGLDQHRIDGARIDIAVFTNLTRDHLEYHGSMDAYAAAKRTLFEQPGLSGAVINLDDPFGRTLAEDFAGRLNILGYTLEAAPDFDRHSEHRLRAEDLQQTDSGVRFRVRDTLFEAPLVGRFNVANLLAVIGTLLLGGESLADCAQALRQITPPPGRMQILGGSAAPLVVVDYAHTPDALEQVLTTLRGTATARAGQLVCLFGCGGERDPGKRPQMGAIAERLADAVVITSDNPRGENPQAIIDQILAGMAQTPAVEADRAAAIRAAVAAADVRDVILLAGKGHELYQEVAGVRLPFSDLATAQAALAERQDEPC